MTITVNGKEIDSSDVKSFNREIARVRRAEKKDNELRRANQDQARLHAMANGFRILHGKVSANMSPYWELVERNNQHFPGYFRNDSEHDSVWNRITRVETNTGSAPIGHGGLELLAGIIDRAGFCVALCFQNNEGMQICCAVGIHEGEYCLGEIPGVTMDDFRNSETE